jgi:hypothetical protein
MCLPVRIPDLDRLTNGGSVWTIVWILVCAGQNCKCECELECPCLLSATFFVVDSLVAGTYIDNVGAY